MCDVTRVPLPFLFFVKKKGDKYFDRSEDNGSSVSFCSVLKLFFFFFSFRCQFSPEWRSFMEPIGRHRRSCSFARSNCDFDFITLGKKTQIRLIDWLATSFTFLSYKRRIFVLENSIAFVVIEFHGNIGFYWVSIGSNGFYWLIMGYTSFHWLKTGYNRFYWVPIGYIEFILGFSRLKWVLLGYYGLDWIIIGYTSFYWLKMGYNRFYWVPMGYIGSCWVITG